MRPTKPTSLSKITAWAGAPTARTAGAVLIVALAGFGLYQGMSMFIDRSVRDALDRNPEAVQRIIKDYITKNPDVMQLALTEMIKSRMPQLAAVAGGSAKGAPDAAAPPARPRVDHAAVIKANAQQIFASSRSMAIGNPDGDVTLVEFFDYNCGFCKRALSDMDQLLGTDKALKVVLKELPILGQGSVEASRVAHAVRLQDASGKTYKEFHKRLMASPGPINKDRALALARELGMDMARVATDMDGGEVMASIEESRNLARALGITGTPSYVVGEQVVAGAVGHVMLAEKIKLARR